jgi:hypothetical protein
MAAQYPNQIPVFTTKIDNVDTVFADHINRLQEEVIALATKLGTNLTTTGSLVYISADGNLAAIGTDLTWDSVNNRLGINNNTPTYTLDVVGRLRAVNSVGPQMLMDTPTTGQQALLSFFSAGSQKWFFGKQTDDAFLVYDHIAAKTKIHIAQSGDISLMPDGGGGVKIGGYGVSNGLLDVQGTIYAAEDIRPLRRMVAPNGANGIDYSGSVSGITVSGGIVVAAS